MAMMCSTRLIRRFPARESRCRMLLAGGGVERGGAGPGGEVGAGRGTGRRRRRRRAAGRRRPGRCRTGPSARMPVAATASVSCLLECLELAVEPRPGRRPARRPAPGGSFRPRPAAGPSASSALACRAVRCRACPAGDQLGAAAGAAGSRSGSERGPARRGGRPAAAAPPSPRRRPAAADPGCAAPTISDRVRVGGVGLAALPGGEHPRPRRQLRRHIHHASRRRRPAAAPACRPTPWRPRPPRSAPATRRT